MANITVICTDNLFKVDFGDYAGDIGDLKKAFWKKDVTFELKSDRVIARHKEDSQFPISFNGVGDTWQVDSIQYTTVSVLGGVITVVTINAITTNLQLYNALVDRQG